MKELLGPVVMRTRSGKAYKVCFWGHDDYHIMDWNGCNYRYKAVSGQPLRGYPNILDANKFLRELLKDTKRLEKEKNMVLFETERGSFLQEGMLI